MGMHRLSLSQLSKSLLIFCVCCLVMVVTAAWMVNAFFSGYVDESYKQAQQSQNIAREIDQSLIPINRELSDIRQLISAFSNELALLSIDV